MKVLQVYKHIIEGCGKYVSEDFKDKIINLDLNKFKKAHFLVSVQFKDLNLSTFR